MSTEGLSTTEGGARRRRAKGVFAERERGENGVRERTGETCGKNADHADSDQSLSLASSRAAAAAALWSRKKRRSLFFEEFFYLFVESDIV